MGRELRRVPPNWDHPRDESNGGFVPMFDENIKDAVAEWLKDFDRVRAGHLTKYERKTIESRPALIEWLTDNPPPTGHSYRPWKDEEATWFQVWETVSEGTPVTPPFATKEELVAYLVEHGDFWQQKRWQDGNRFMQPEKPGYSRANAEAFVMGDGWAPSMVIMHDGKGNTTIAEGINVPGMMNAGK